MIEGEGMANDHMGRATISYIQWTSVYVSTYIEVWYFLTFYFLGKFSKQSAMMI